MDQQAWDKRPRRAEQELGFTDGYKFLYLSRFQLFSGKPDKVARRKAAFRQILEGAN